MANIEDRVINVGLFAFHILCLVASKLANPHD